jgi:hypothetical protein
MFDLAWSRLLVGQRAFLLAVDQLTWMADAETVTPALAGRVTMLRSIAAAMSCDWEGCGSLARQALLELGDGWRTDPVGRFGWNMVAREVAFSESWQGGHLAVLEAQHSLSADPERRLALEGTRALGESLAGHPVDALRVGAGIRHAAVVSGRSILLGELAARRRSRTASSATATGRAPSSPTSRRSASSRSATSSSWPCTSSRPCTSTRAISGLRRRRSISLAPWSATSSAGRAGDAGWPGSGRH